MPAKKPLVETKVEKKPGSTVRTVTRRRNPAKDTPKAVPVPPKAADPAKPLFTCGDCMPTRNSNKYLCMCSESRGRTIFSPQFSPEKVSVEAGVRRPPTKGAGLRGLPGRAGGGILIVGLIAAGLFAYSRMSGSSTGTSAT